MKKKIKPLDLAYEQYEILKTKLKATRDARERNIIFRRLTNLLAVIEFLISVNSGS